MVYVTPFLLYTNYCTVCAIRKRNSIVDKRASERPLPTASKPTVTTGDRQCQVGTPQCTPSASRITSIPYSVVGAFWMCRAESPVHQKKPFVACPCLSDMAPALTTCPAFFPVGNVRRIGDYRRIPGRTKRTYARIRMH